EPTHHPQPPGGRRCLLPRRRGRSSESPGPPGELVRQAARSPRCNSGQSPGHRGPARFRCRAGRRPHSAKHWEAPLLWSEWPASIWFLRIPLIQNLLDCISLELREVIGREAANVVAQQRVEVLVDACPDYVVECALALRNQLGILDLFKGLARVQDDLFKHDLG